MIEWNGKEPKEIHWQGKDIKAVYSDSKAVWSASRKLGVFGTINITPAPLYYGANGFEIVDNDWNHDSFGALKGKTEGSYYFNFVEVGSRFDSRGENFNVNSGDINNNITLTYGGYNDWRVPSMNELKTLINMDGYTRDGSTVNGNINKHYAMIQLTGVTFAGNSTPSGLLLFPDNRVIDGVELSNLDNSTLNTGITNGQLNVYLEQGCVFLPCCGDYFQVWESSSAGVSGSQLSNHQYDSTQVVRLRFTSGAVVIGDTFTGKDSVWWMWRLVRTSDD